MAKADHGRDALEISIMLSRMLQRIAELESETDTLRGQIKAITSKAPKVPSSSPVKVVSNRKPGAVIAKRKGLPKLRCPKIAVEVTPGTTIAPNRKVGAVIVKRKGASSQYYGVAIIQSSGTWHARVDRKGARKNFGNFPIEEKAALAVQEFLGNAAECKRIRAIIAEKYPPEENAVDVRHKKEAADGLAAIGGAFTWKWECKGCGETFDQYPEGGCPKCCGYSFEKIKVLNDPDVEISRAVGRHSKK